MAVSLSDAAVAYGATKTETAITRMYMQMSPFLEELPMQKIQGRSTTFPEEQALPIAGFRAVNQAWAESTGSIIRRQESLFILGGQVEIDNFIDETDDGGDFNNRAVQIKLKVQAISNAYDSATLEGDDRVDPNSMVGFRRRATGAQVLMQATGGGALTLAALDQLIDSVPFPNKRLYTNRALRRKIKTLSDAVGGSVYFDESRDTFGTQPARYAGIPIRIIEQSGDASTLLGFDEDPGDGVSDTASIYCVALGDDAVHGIWNGRKPLQLKDLGESSERPRKVLRWEGYVGMVTRHQRSYGRLRGILNA